MFFGYGSDYDPARPSTSNSRRSETRGVGVADIPSFDLFNVVGRFALVHRNWYVLFSPQDGLNPEIVVPPTVVTIAPHQVIEVKEATRASDPALQPTRILWGAYAPGNYTYEVLGSRRGAGARRNEHRVVRLSMRRCVCVFFFFYRSSHPRRPRSTLPVLKLAVNMASSRPRSRSADGFFIDVRGYPNSSPGLRVHAPQVVECGRRLLLTSALVMIEPGTTTQCALACVFAFLSLVAFELIMPYTSKDDAWLYRMVRGHAAFLLQAESH